MKGVEYLKQIRDIKVRIIGLEMQMSEIETRLTKTTQRVKEISVQTSLPADPMADLVIKKVELEDKIIMQINNQWDIIIEAMDILDTMASQEFKKLLTLRYINCLTHKEMMSIMDVSRATVIRRLSMAEKAFDEIYEKMKQNNTM